MTFSLEGFDVNGNGILNGQEIVKKLSLKKNPRFKRMIKKAWIDSKMNSDYKTVTKPELAQFI